MKIKILEIGFLLDLITREDLLEWSNLNLINGKLDEVFIELSSITSKNTNEQIISILNNRSEKKITKNEFQKFHLIFLSFVFNSYSDWKDIQNILVKYDSINSEYFEEREFEFWSRLKDDYTLRKEGFTGCMNMPSELNEYFNKYQINKSNETFLRYTDFFLA